MLDHQPPGLRAVAPGIPALGHPAEQLAQDGKAFGHVRPFNVDVDVLITDPAQPVTGDVVPQFPEGGDRVGVPARCLCHGEHRERQPATFEGAQHPPQPRP